MRDSTFSYKLLHDVKLTQSRSYVLFSRKVHYLAHFLKTLVYRIGDFYQSLITKIGNIYPNLIF